MGILKYLPFLRGPKELSPSPLLPGRTIDELAGDLNLPELNDLYGTQQPSEILAINIAGHTETLCYLPNNHGAAFALAVHMDNVNANPVIRLAFKEVAESRFQICGYTVRYDETHQLILPEEKSAPPIRRVQQELLNHLEAA